MNENPILAQHDLPLTLMQRIDPLCSAFEAACQAAGTSGSLPILEKFLAECAESDRGVLLRELIILEVHYRRLRGGPVHARDYTARFPNLDLTWLGAALETSSLQPQD